MTDSEIAEIRRTKTELDARAKTLKREQIKLRGEYDAIQAACSHPGLKLGRDYSGDADGRCEICGKCW